MAEYIEREAICKAYMDLCMAKSRLAKARKGAAFFTSDLLPEAEPTVKELFGLINAATAADSIHKGCRKYADANQRHSPYGITKQHRIPPIITEVVPVYHFPSNNAIDPAFLLYITNLPVL